MPCRFYGEGRGQKLWVFVCDVGFSARELPWMCGSSSRRLLRMEPRRRSVWDACLGHFEGLSPRASGCCSKMRNPCFGICSKRSFVTRSRRSLRRVGFVLTATRSERSMTIDPGSWTHCLVVSRSRRHAFAVAPAVPNLRSPWVDHCGRWPVSSRTDQHLNCSAFKLYSERGLRFEKQRVCGTGCLIRK